MLVVVGTRDHQILLLERMSPSGFWQSITGSLEWGEKALEAAERELKEETGLCVALENCHMRNRFPIALAWRRRYGPGVIENIEYVFRTILPTAQPVILNSKEHRQYIWVEKKEALERLSSWTNREAIRQGII